MNESLLKSLIRLFSFVVETEKGQFSESALKVIADFLSKELSREQVKEYLGEIGFITSKDIDQDLPTRSSIEKICSEINSEFEQHQKVWLVLQLVEFLNDTGSVSENKLNLIQTIAKEFNIPNEEFNNGKSFILANSPDEIPVNLNVIRVDGEDNVPKKEINYIFKPKLLGQVYFLRIPTTNTLLVKYFGNTNLFLNSKTLRPSRAYIFGVGGVIRAPRTEPIYYSQIIGTLFQSWRKTTIELAAYEASYRHKGSKDGVYPFSFEANSGQLVAIMGGSGVGKSTLINLLNGNLKPASGSISINGFDIHNDKDEIEGAIGYVPQDDLLVEDLTVFQNLYFGARFCFSNKSKEEIIELVEETLKDFDLHEARDLKVGNPLNKFISGGQRKRLNIAMEIIREPAILFVDEPTSGLSSFDSERIIHLLKRQTFKGKIVIANVHQPSSDIYKLFDKLMVMDHGGRIIFQGNPMDAIVYFKHEGQFLKAEESECLCCGNVNTEQILRIIEARVVNEYGKLTRKRKRSASEWYERYLENIQSKIIFPEKQKRISLPNNSFSIPNRWKQSMLFIKRNLQSKLANKQFMLIALLEAPILALVLGFFSKFISGTLNNPNEYIFSNNTNIPSFLFMSVVAAMFMGLTISAEEIIKDQRVRQRERFLNLSYFSYINSKILTLMVFSAIQTLLFVSVGHAILEINGTFFSTWFILFVTAVCANLIGLNISAALNSVVSIYITIPLIIIPMLLLSGVVVSFDKLYRTLLHPEYVPVVGDINPIRWSHEALCVKQFKDNRFNRHFYDYEQQISNNTYYASFLIPRLQIKLDETAKSISTKKITDITRSDLTLVKNEMRLLQRDLNLDDVEYPKVPSYNPHAITLIEINKLNSFLVDLKKKLQDNSKKINKAKEKRYEQLIEKLGGPDKAFSFRRENHNNALEDLVLNRNEFEKIAIYKYRLIRKHDPAYAIPTSIYGRAHMFAPIKRLGNLKIGTLWFNAMAIGLMSLVLYFMLLTNMLRAINKYLERFKFRRLARRISRYIPH